MVVFQDNELGRLAVAPRILRVGLETTHHFRPGSMGLLDGRRFETETTHKNEDLRETGHGVEGGLKAQAEAKWDKNPIGAGLSFLGKITGFRRKSNRTQAEEVTKCRVPIVEALDPEEPHTYAVWHFEAPPGYYFEGHLLPGHPSTDDKGHVYFVTVELDPGQEPGSLATPKICNFGDLLLVDDPDASKKEQRRVALLRERLERDANFKGTLLACLERHSIPYDKVKARPPRPTPFPQRRTRLQCVFLTRRGCSAVAAGGITTQQLPVKARFWDQRSV